MKFSEVKDHVGDLVTINNSNDLLFDGEFKRPYYRKYIFEIIKITRGGKIYIKSVICQKYLSLKAVNIDLVFLKIFNIPEQI